MLRIHFLNVGHGDCTIIKHHSGRLTVIDINNSQDYDENSFKEFIEERSKPKTYLASLLSGDQRPAISNPYLGLSSLTNEPAIPTNYLATLLGANSRPAISNPRLGLSPPKNALAIGRGLEQMALKSQAKGELTDPIAFLQEKYPGQKLWRFVLTHPDLDHMRGIKNLHDTIGFENFWDTNHTKPTPVFGNDADKVDWEFYQKLRAGNVGPNRQFYTRGDSLFAFGRDENGRPGGDNIEILSPHPDLVSSCNKAGKSNSLSLVLRVAHAGKSILLPGDAEDDAWDIMTTFYGDRLKSDFLKASHHGRDTGYNLKAVQLISPIITFVSVGRKPDTDASSKYRQQCLRVASTRYHGNIELQIHDDGQYKWFVDRNPG